jgi:hypothetical protein
MRNNGQGGYSAGFAFQYNFGGLITDSDRAFQELEAHYGNAAR